jgi:hypothetical protein
MKLKLQAQRPMEVKEPQMHNYGPGERSERGGEDTRPCSAGKRPPVVQPVSQLAIELSAHNITE